MLSKYMMIAALVFSSSELCLAQKSQQALRRPFRVGFFKLSPFLDHQKPLAPADFAGWVQHSGMLIGSPNTTDLIVFSIKNKTELWRRALSGELSIPAFPISNGVIIGQQDGTLAKLDFQTGQVIWEQKLPSFVSVRLTKDNERIFAVTASHVLYAISFQDGKIEWLYDPELPKNEIRIHNTAAPSVYLSQLYWGLSSGEIVGIDIPSGKKLWRRNPKLSGGGRFHNYMGSMVVANKRLVFCRYDGLIGAASLENSHEGELLWEVEGNTGNCSDSDFRSGRFYAVTTSGDALSINAETGKSLWSGVKLGMGLSTVSAIEDSVIITGSDGGIYSLTQDGMLDWYDNIDGRLLTHPVFSEKEAYFASGLKNIYSYKI